MISINNTNPPYIYKLFIFTFFYNCAMFLPTEFKELSISYKLSSTLNISLDECESFYDNIVIRS